MSFLTPLYDDPASSFQLENARTGGVLARQVLTAFDSASRRRGLLKRDSMPPESALIIAPSNAVHTWFMRFPIDIVFVRRDGVVVKIRESVAPWRLAAALRGYAVVELAAGALRDRDVRIGDTLTVRSRRE
jgi:uncharacterized membrane protein (UPF0127 family)